MPDEDETLFEKQPEICVDKMLPLTLQVDAAERAIEENPANLAIFRHSPGLGVTPGHPLSIALVTGKKWQNGRTLHVRFLGGTAEVQAKVRQFAVQWSDFANITLAFDDSPNAEIRIAFVRDGSWSYIGTDALLVPAGQATMNFGWFGPGTTDEEYSRTVLHEFGHALGCIHEHQHPENDIPWDREAVFRYYMGPPNNWPREEVETNLFQKYSRDQTQFSQFDKQSIMLYAIDESLTAGAYTVGWNRELSPSDKSFIGVCYPKAQAADPARPLTVGTAVEGEIGQHGAEDLYRFSVAARGRFAAETSGETDVVMSLLGPDSQARLAGDDDDSGAGRNAKIVRDLDPGTYWLRVRHFQPTGSGRYGLVVQAG
jgi:hypothetical protein